LRLLSNWLNRKQTIDVCTYLARMNIIYGARSRVGTRGCGDLFGFTDKPIKNNPGRLTVHGFGFDYGVIVDSDTVATLR